MPWARVAAITAGVAAALWLCLDAGLGDTPPAPAAASVALIILAGIFGAGTWVMRIAGRRERIPLLAGLAIATAGYALIRLTLPH